MMVAAFFNDPVKLAAARARYVAKMQGTDIKPLRPPKPVKRDYILVATVQPPLHRAVKDIITEVAHAYGFKYREIVGPRRERDLIAARFAAYHAVSTARPELSLPQIGRHFGGRDHTTILHGLRKVQRDGVPLPTKRPIALSAGEIA